MPRRKRKRANGVADTAAAGGPGAGAGKATMSPATNLGARLRRAAKEAAEGVRHDKKREENQPDRESSPSSMPATQRPPGPEPLAPVSVPPKPDEPAGRPPDATELRWLNDAYQGVTPLHHAPRVRTRRAASIHGGTDSAGSGARDDRGRGHPAAEEAARQRLDALVGEDIRFVVEEREDGWVAARRQGVGPQALRRLRGAGFAAEASLDLHGHARADVRRLVTSFVRNQHRAGCRYALIVHGKGLHSPDGHGVLGDAVFETLTRGGAAPLIRALSTPDGRHGGRGATAIEIG